MVTCTTYPAELVADMNDDPVMEPLPPEDQGNIRFLRILVTVLTATMIAGLIAIFTVIVIRFPSGTDTLPLPDQIVLPEGVNADAVTFMQNRVIVVSGNEILVFDIEGALQRRISLSE